MTYPRRSPFVWATWLPKLLIGYNTCEWSAWFMAHYQGYEREEDVPYRALEAHAALLKQTREEFEARGYCVTVEGENKFSITSRTGATLRGVPDLIAVSERPVIVEVKSGKHQPFDRMQLLLYMHAVPRADNLNYEGMTFEGLLVYPDKVEVVPPAELEDFRPRLKELLKRVLSGSPARKEPSERNCRFCKLTTADCPEKIHSRLPPRQAVESPLMGRP